MSRRVIALFAGLSLAISDLHAATIWREGEQPDRQNMHRHPWWYDQVKKEVLSGGDWISNFSDKGQGTAEYDIAVPETADSTFRLPANPTAVEPSYAVDVST